jgi:hypothetical protein
MAHRPLSYRQRKALFFAEKGKVAVNGRGCKATIDGLAIRGYVGRVRLDPHAFGDCYIADLTEAGEEKVRQVKAEGIGES